MSNTLIINGIEYIKKDAAPPKEGQRLIIGIVDNRGLTFVGMTDFTRNEHGYITLENAQCVIKWWTNAHLNHLAGGVCSGVELGAPATIYVKEFIMFFEPDFPSVDAWKAAGIAKGSKEVFSE